MKFLQIVVDEPPRSCILCPFVNYSEYLGYHFCKVAFEVDSDNEYARVSEKRKAKNCPLITSLQLSMGIEKEPYNKEDK